MKNKILSILLAFVLISQTVLPVMAATEPAVQHEDTVESVEKLENTDSMSAVESEIDKTKSSEKETLAQEVKYDVMVEGAKAEPDQAAEGTRVNLTADEQEGKVFDRWDVTEGVEITDDSFIMPAQDVQVKAVFKSVKSTPMPMMMSANQLEKKVLNAQDTTITTPLVFTASEDQSGAGYSWVASTKTLTLNNVNISTSSTAIVVPADATIVLEGTNKINSTDDGIIVDTDVNTDTLTIKGTGTLDIQAVWFSIYASSPSGHSAGLTIESGTINSNTKLYVGNNLTNIGGNITVPFIDCVNLTTEGGEITASKIEINENASIDGGRVKCNGDFNFGCDGWGHSLYITNGKLVVNGQIIQGDIASGEDQIYDMGYYYFEGPGAFIQKNGTNLNVGGIVSDDDSDLDLTGVTTMTVAGGASFAINDCSKFNNITFKNIGSIDLPKGSTENSINLSPESTGKLMVNGVEIGKDRKNVTYKDLSGTIHTVKATPMIDKLEEEILDTGWYVVEDTKTLKDLIIKGNVNLILADGCTLNVNKALIESNNEYSLTIWGGEQGTGKAFIRGNKIDNSLNIEYDSMMTINGGTIEVTGNAPIYMTNSSLIVNNGILKAVSSATGEESIDIESFLGNTSKLEIGEEGTVEADKIDVQELRLNGKLIGNGPHTVDKLYDKNGTEIQPGEDNKIAGSGVIYSGYNKLLEFKEEGIKIECTFEGKNFLLRRKIVRVENSEGAELNEVIEPGNYIAVYTENGSEIKKPFKVSFAEITGNIVQKGELIYDGEPKTAQITNNLVSRGENAITVTYGTKEGACNSENVPAFTEIGEHVVYYKATAPKHAEKVGSFTVKISKIPTEFENGIKAYKGDVEKTEFTYGDIITVKAKPIMKGPALVSAAGKTISMFSLPITALTSDQMALYVGDEQISEPVSAGSDGYYVMTLNTTDEIVRTKLKPGQLTNVTARFTGNTYMAEAEGNISLKVNKAPITVISESKTVNYGDEIPAYTAAYTGFVNGETFEQTITGQPDFDSTYVKNSDVGGDYVITPKKGTLASDRYTFVYEASGKVIVNKVKAAIATDPTAVTGLVYTAEAKELVTAGTTNDGEILYSLNNKDFAKNIPTAMDAGNYTVYYKVVGDSNHTDSDVAEVSNITIERANPAADMFTVSDLTYTYDGTEKKPVVTLNPENNDKGVGAITVNTSGVNVADSKNEISFSVAESANYNAADFTINEAFTINRADPDKQMFIISENVYNYDGNEHTAVVTSDDGIVGMGVITVNSRATNVADSKVVEISVAEGENYNAADIQLDGMLTINPGDLSKEMFDVTDNVYTYDGIEHKPTVTVNQAYKDKGVGVITVNTKATNVADSKAIEVSVSKGANYNAKTITLDEELTINAKPITGAEIALDGTLKYNGNTQTQKVKSVTVDGLTATYDVTNNTGKDADTYAMTITGNGNFTGEVTKEFIVEQHDALDLTTSIGLVRLTPGYENSITVADIPGYPKDTVTGPDLSLGTGVPGKNTTATLENGVLKFAADNTSETKAGKQVINLTGMKNYKDSTITVIVNYTDKTPVTISGVKVDNKEYDGKAVKYTGNPDAKSAEGSSVETKGYTYTWEKEDGTKLDKAPAGAGKYKLVIAVKDIDPQYTGSIIIPFSIDKKTVTVTAEDKRAHIGKEEPAYTYKVSGFIGSDKLTGKVTFTDNSANMNTVGTYSITPAGGTAGKNYTISYVAGTLTVEDHKWNNAKDETKHWQECSVCGVRKDEAEHIWENPQFEFAKDGKSATAKATCECGNVSEKKAVVTEKITTPATCSVNGITTYTATVTFNGTEYTAKTTRDDVQLNPDNHNSELEYVEAKAATCETDGNKEYWKCNDCGNLYSDKDGKTKTTLEKVTLKAIGHKWSEPVITFAEDGRSATALVTCKKDKAHTQELDTEVTSKVKVKPTKESKGTTTYTATVTFEGKTYTATKDVEDIPKIQPVEKIEKVVQKELTEVPEALKNTEINTIEKISKALENVVAEKMKELSASLESDFVLEDYKTYLFDAVLMITDENGVSRLATKEEVEARGGITIVIPYPEGTNKSDYVFTVAHMFAMDISGMRAGDIETPEITLTDEGLKVTLKGLSPIMVGYSKKSIETSKPSKTTNNDISTGSKETNKSNKTPRTGDNSHVDFWLMISLVSVCGLATTVITKKKKYQ